jgi:hypothetical protein
MNQAESKAMQELLDTLHHKLNLAMTCGAYHRGTNKKTIDNLVLQLNTLYKLCGVNHTVTI